MRRAKLSELPILFLCVQLVRRENWFEFHFANRNNFSAQQSLMYHGSAGVFNFNTFTITLRRTARYLSRDDDAQPHQHRPALSLDKRNFLINAAIATLTFNIIRGLRVPNGFSRHVGTRLCTRHRYVGCLLLVSNPYSTITFPMCRDHWHC